MITGVLCSTHLSLSFHLFVFKSSEYYRIILKFCINENFNARLFRIENLSFTLIDIARRK